MAVEDPGDSPVISARYGTNYKSRKNATDFLPFFGTDIGMSHSKLPVKVLIKFTIIRQIHTYSYIFRILFFSPAAGQFQP